MRTIAGWVLTLMYFAFSAAAIIGLWVYSAKYLHQCVPPIGQELAVSLLALWGFWLYLVYNVVKFARNRFAPSMPRIAAYTAACIILCLAAVLPSFVTDGGCIVRVLGVLVFIVGSYSLISTIRSLWVAPERADCIVLYYVVVAFLCTRYAGSQGEELYVYCKRTLFGGMTILAVLPGVWQLSQQASTFSARRFRLLFALLSIVLVAFCWTLLWPDPKTGRPLLFRDGLRGLDITLMATLLLGQLVGRELLPSQGEGGSERHTGPS